MRLSFQSINRKDPPLPNVWEVLGNEPDKLSCEFCGEPYNEDTYVFEDDKYNWGYQLCPRCRKHVDNPQFRDALYNKVQTDINNARARRHPAMKSNSSLLPNEPQVEDLAKVSVLLNQSPADTDEAKYLVMEIMNIIPSRFRQDYSTWTPQAVGKSLANARQWLTYWTDRMDEGEREDFEARVVAGMEAFDPMVAEPTEEMEESETIPDEDLAYDVEDIS